MEVDAIKLNLQKEIMKLKYVIVILFFLTMVFNSHAQNDSLSDRPMKEYAINRPANILSLGVGTSVANADLPEAKFDLNILIGYKRRLSPSFLLAVEYNKFNIVFDDNFNEGFMSFDFNLEYHFTPKNKFTPYILVGPGLNAANGFEDSGFKFQAGLGIELMVSNGLGLKLQADRSFLSEDLLEGIEFGATNDSYYRITFGTNIYFPLSDRPRVKDDESFIKANQIKN